jgi:hypothetical protein
MAAVVADSLALGEDGGLAYYSIAKGDWLLWVR